MRTIIGVTEIAKICHEANKAYCEGVMNDNSQRDWDRASSAQRISARKGVQLALTDPTVTPRKMHESWADEKRKTGWVYGEEKDETAKTHPCLVDYDQLPLEQRVKDSLFLGIVNALRRFYGE